MLIGVAATVVVTVVIVQIIGCDEKEAGTAAKAGDGSIDTAKKAETPAGNEDVFCPLNGELKPLSEVNDPTFSGEILGKGVAILPSEGKLYAPFDGNVSMVFDTRHAIGLTKDDMELLIHIGLETVSLEGKYFEAKVKTGDQVKKGDLLIEFDLEAIAKEGFDTITPVIVNNVDDFADIGRCIRRGTSPDSQKVGSTRRFPGRHKKKLKQYLSGSIQTQMHKQK